MSDSRLEAQDRVDQQTHPHFEIAAEHEEARTQIPMGPVKTKQETPSDAVYSTVVVSTTVNPVKLAFPRDPNRHRGVILSIDEDIVLCSTKEAAQNAANEATGVPYPVGFYLSKGIEHVIHNQDA